MIQSIWAKHQWALFKISGREARTWLVNEHNHQSAWNYQLSLLAHWGLTGSFRIFPALPCLETSPQGRAQGKETSLLNEGSASCMSAVCVTKKSQLMLVSTLQVMLFIVNETSAHYQNVMRKLVNFQAWSVAGSQLNGIKTSEETSCD